MFCNHLGLLSLFTAVAEYFNTTYKNNRWSTETMACENAGFVIEISEVLEQCFPTNIGYVLLRQKIVVVALCNTHNSCNISDPVTTFALRSSCMEDVQTILIQFDCISGK